MFVFIVIFELFSHLVSSRAVRTKVATSILPNLLQRPSLMALAYCAMIVLWGCGSGTSIHLAESLVVSPGTVDFGSITVGGNADRNVLIANNAPFPLVISQANVTGQGFSIAGGQAMPLTIAANSSSSLKIDFAPGSVATYSGQVTLMDASNKVMEQIALHGQGSNAPVSELSLSAISLDFGSMTVGEAVTRPLTLTCAGTVPVTISSATIQGFGFAVVDGGLPVTLSPAQTATLQVQFDPKAAGPANGQLTINSDASNGNAATVSLQGTGSTSAAPQLFISTASLNFGGVTVGSPTTRPLTLTSAGNSPVTVTTATISGTGFAVSGISLPAVLSPGQSMTVEVQFNPTSTGVEDGKITVNSDSLGSGTAVVSLSGSGIAAAAPQLSLSTASLNFGDVTVDSPTTKPLTLMSTGSSPLTVSSATIDGAGLTVSGVSLPAVLSPGQSMTLQVQFNPAATGAVIGQIAINSDSSGGAVVVSLSGMGIATAAPRLSISTASLNFGGVTVGSPTTQPLTLTSTGSSPVTVTAATIRGTEFRVLDRSLPVTLSPGQSITLQIRFNPAIAGGVSGDIVIGSNSRDGVTADVTLTGTGIAATSPQLTLSSLRLGFGDATVGSSTPQPLTLTSTGSSPVTVSSATISGTDFSADSSTLPVTLNPGQSLTLQVQFDPTETGRAHGQLTINSSSSSNGTAVVELNGNGTAVQSPQLALSAASLAFGNVTMNTPTQQPVTLTSSGTSAVTISSATVTGAGFSVVPGVLPVTLDPGASATLQVQFDPTVSGAVNGELTISSNSSSGSTTGVPLSGTGANAPSPQLMLNKASLSFSNIPVNSSATQFIIVTSKGSLPLTISAVATSGTGFSVVGSGLPMTFNDGQSLTLQVEFQPTNAGSVNGMLKISSNIAGGSTVVSLSGSAVSLNPVLTVSPTTLSFGSTALNTPKTQSLTLASTGQTLVTVTSATVSGAGFTLLGGNFPLMLNVGQTTSLTLQFDPLSAGAVTGQLVINSTTNGGTTAVALNGTGTAVTHAVYLSWNAPVSSPEPVTGYHVYRVVGTGTPVLFNSVAETTLDFTDNTVVSGTTYSYFVKSVGAPGLESVASNETQATIP